MRKMIYAMLTFALVISVVSVSLARAGPSKKTFMTDHVNTVDVAVPAVALRVVPLMVGYDVIDNLSTEYKNKVQALAEKRTGQILMVDSDVGVTLRRPEIVLLA